MNSLMKDVAKEIHWETNRLVANNPDIPKEQIFARCSTRNYPYGAVSVKITNQSKGYATLYFRDDMKTRNYSGGHVHEYCDSELKVSLPTHSSWNNQQYNYIYLYSMESDLN